MSILKLFNYSIKKISNEKKKKIPFDVEKIIFLMNKNNIFKRKKN